MRKVCAILFSLRCLFSAQWWLALATSTCRLHSVPYLACSVAKTSRYVYTQKVVCHQCKVENLELDKAVTKHMASLIKQVSFIVQIVRKFRNAQCLAFHSVPSHVFILPLTEALQPVGVICDIEIWGRVTQQRYALNRYAQRTCIQLAQLPQHCTIWVKWSVCLCHLQHQRARYAMHQAADNACHW